MVMTWAGYEGCVWILAYGCVQDNETVGSEYKYDTYHSVRERRWGSIYNGSYRRMYDMIAVRTMDEKKAEKERKEREGELAVLKRRQREAASIDDGFICIRNMSATAHIIN
jgi:transposase